MEANNEISLLTNDKKIKKYLDTADASAPPDPPTERLSPI